MKIPHSDFPAPSKENMIRIGERTFDGFVKQGYNISQALAPFLMTLERKSRVLDLGVGVGRVSSQIYPIYADDLDLYGCDVDETAIAYLTKHFPKIRVMRTNYYPPLPFDSLHFDLVYSISLWTHFCEEDQHRWLREVSRILKPGGIALISIAGEAALRASQDRGNPLWQGVTWRDVEKAGIVYKKYKKPTLDSNCPGTNSDYGGTLLSNAWVQENFSQHLKVESIKPAAISRQDLVVLVK
jgi:SAM-dependent methyltransferase